MMMTTAPPKYTRAVRRIGEAVCRKFIAEGGRVAVADFNSDAGRKLAEELGDDAFFVYCDVKCGP